MTLVIDANKNMYDLISDDAEIVLLEKANKRPLEMEDITKALDEYKRLFKAGLSSPAELITLARAYPENTAFIKAARKEGLFDDGVEPMVVGGPASVELVDREGHLITTKALSKAFDSYMDNFRTRNTMVLHSDVQVGWALPAYITKAGNIYKSGVDTEGLFFITELRGDTRIAKRVMEQIKEGKLKSYSIAGSATKTQNIQKGMESYMQVDDMELAEVTVCEKGVNQGANFDILKADGGRPTRSCIDGSCLMKSEHPHTPTTLLMKEDGGIDFLASLKHLLKADNPFTNSKATDGTPIFGTDAYRKREQLHHRLLDEQGFPSELEPEQNRYIPVSETEVDDDGKIVRQKPPWTVNEAGEDLGTRWTNEALTPPTAGAVTDKPYNLQKFVGLTGQRKKALIIEGYDSATDAFFSKEINEEKPKEIKKFLPILMAIARVAAQAAVRGGAKGAAQGAAKQGAKQGRGGTKGRGRGQGGGGEEDSEGGGGAPQLPVAELASAVAENITAPLSMKKTVDNVQYNMTTDQRTSSLSTMWRRKNVASGEPSLIPLLIDLTRATTTRKSDDCGCD